MDHYTRVTTCDQLSRLMDLNTLGIIAMREGKNIDAILLFREAIKLVQSILSSSDDGPLSINGTGMLINNLSLEKKVVVSGNGEKGISIIKSIPIDDKNDYSMHDDVFMLYKRALHLAPGITTVVTGELSLYQIVSCVLLYNYGLVNHLEGLRTCDSWLLSQALDHYSRAYHIMKALGDDRFPENATSSSLGLGLLAIANNVGHIHASNCRNTKVCVCCDEIMRLLSTTRPPVSADGYSLDEEYKLIFLNVCFFLEANLAGAPAA